MCSYSFFMDYEFRDTVAGFYGTFSGEKIYEVEYYERVEGLIDDCMKLLKSKHGAMLTFSAFQYSQVNLMRIFREENGSLTRVVWNRETRSLEPELKNEPFNKKAVKRAVLDAIELFREEEAKTA